MRTVPSASVLQTESFQTITSALHQTFQDHELAQTYLLHYRHIVDESLWKVSRGTVTGQAETVPFIAAPSQRPQACHMHSSRAVLNTLSSLRVLILSI